ncbi:hypothetical protein AXE65_02445 [Ventosimonas gracilis]|uniref:OmpH family outer membrane protein n=1 Tax=Ventosimonas gracilis TaxID=1680762 RepID=A0A139SUA9_9GAMM|nr:OmpH family outer membrane protein [Ventosimonas gracilis]KXU38163.1 hypothetical protein AXE65_02445 [Ventosimonas gracilis]
MRNFSRIALLTASLLAPLAPAVADEFKIAVLDYQQALLESDAAKRYAVDSEKRFGPQLEKLKKLESEAERLQKRLVNEGDKLTQADRERLDLEFRQKARDLQTQTNELNQAKALSDREVLEKLRPNLNKAVEEVIKKGGYDLVLDRAALVDLKPSLDITKQVIERMNQLK